MSVLAPRRRPVLLLALLVIGALAASCSSRAAATSSGATPRAGSTASAITLTTSPTPLPTASPTPTPTPTLYGVARPIPPHAASPSAADRQALDTVLPTLGGAVGASFLYTPAGGIPAAAATAVAHARQLGLTPVVSIGFDAETGGRYAPTVDLMLPGVVGTYMEALVGFAKATHPRYLGIGNDLNRLWAEDPGAYDAFVGIAPTIVAAIHRVSPRTLVFATFQYEALSGAPVGGAGARPTSHWVLLEQLAPALDLVAFTSRPHLAYATPAAIPGNYYTQAVAHAGGRPIAFTAIGWPAAPAPGGTPAQQAVFIARLPALMQGVAPRFLLWPSAYDDPAVGPPAGALGLADSDGTARPALAAWQQLVAKR